MEVFPTSNICHFLSKALFRSFREDMIKPVFECDVNLGLSSGSFLCMGFEGLGLKRFAQNHQIIRSNLLKSPRGLIRLNKVN